MDRRAHCGYASVSGRDRRVGEVGPTRTRAVDRQGGVLQRDGALDSKKKKHEITLQLDESAKKIDALWVQKSWILGQIEDHVAEGVRVSL